jgi:hypothetical protein
LARRNRYEARTEAWREQGDQWLATIICANG